MNINTEQLSRTDIAKLFFNGDQNSVTRLINSGVLVPFDNLNKTYKFEDVYNIIIKTSNDKIEAKIKKSYDTKINNIKKSKNKSESNTIKEKNELIKELNKNIKELNSVISKNEQEIETLKTQLVQIQEDTEDLPITTKVKLKIDLQNLEKSYYSTLKIKESIITSLSEYCNIDEMNEYFSKILITIRERLLKSKFTLAEVLEHKNSEFIINELDQFYEKLFNEIKKIKFNPKKKDNNIDDLFIDSMDDEIKEIKEKVSK